MKRTAFRVVALVVLAAAGVGFTARPAAAQGRIVHHNFPSPQACNPTFVPTQLQTNAFNQWAQQTAVVGQVYSQNYAPWLIHNPYPQAVNYGPVIQTPVTICPPQVPATGLLVSQLPVPSGPTCPVAVAPASAYVNPYAAACMPYSNPYLHPEAVDGH